MAKSLLPDPLELLRQAVNRLEGRANALAGRGMEIDQVVKTLHQVSSLTMVLRQAMELALDNFYKRLNLPTGREFAEMSATLQRLEDKLDSLLAAQAPAPSAARPLRTRKPAAEAPAATPAAKVSAATPAAKVSAAKPVAKAPALKPAPARKAASGRRRRASA